MNKMYVWIVVAVVVVGGVAAYLAMSSKPTDGTMAPASSNQMATNTNEPAQPATTGRSMKDLLTSGVAQQCDFSDTSNKVTTKGTVYVGTGKLRGDFTTTDALHTTKAHTIVLDQKTYTWLDGMSTGFMSSLGATSTPAPANQTGVTPDKNVNYQCSGWLVDQSKFNLPANVEFSDLSSMMPKGIMPINAPGATGGVQGGAGY